MTTALHLAIAAEATACIKSLVVSMASGVSERAGPLLTSAIKQMALTMPFMVLPTLQVMAGEELTGWNADRAQAPRQLAYRCYRTERVDLCNIVVAGSDTARDEPAVGESAVGVEMWEELQSHQDHPLAKRQLVEFKVCVLPDLLDASVSPLQAICHNCDADVMESAILRHAIEYKWQYTAPRLRRLAAAFLSNFILASTAMVCASHVDLCGTTATDGLVGCLIAAEVIALGGELRQIYRCVCLSCPPPWWGYCCLCHLLS